MRKIRLWMMTLLILAGLAVGLSIPTAAGTSRRGTWGTLTWELDTATGHLTVSGNGEMIGLYDAQSEAWLACRTEIRSVTVESGVTTVGDGAFMLCKNMKSITIPESITYIGMSAFQACASLESIVIPSSVRVIESDVFAVCPELGSITVKEGNEVYHSAGNCVIHTASQTVIAGCKNSVIPNDRSVTSIASRAFIHCYGLKTVVIPDSVTEIDYHSFWNCFDLESVTLGTQLETLREWAFSGCESLKNLTVKKGNQKYHSDGNCIIETEKKTLVLGCKSSVIPTDGSVTTIGVTAFSDCTMLTSIRIPNSVTTIGAEAFYGCERLKSIVYCGTVSQWNSIQKGGNWDQDAGRYTVSYHAWGAEQITKKPTHTEMGEKTVSCTYCGETKTDTVEKISAHNYTEWEMHDEKSHKGICSCGSSRLSSLRFDDKKDAECSNARWWSMSE
ncbi:MAG: leucine-rich repeat domain-containing protein [Clostridia bacterium]|nr:leucine-rich repeat domain-containing protein [Clostridia bacterium]